MNNTTSRNPSVGVEVKKIDSNKILISFDYTFVKKFRSLGVEEQKYVVSSNEVLNVTSAYGEDHLDPEKHEVLKLKNGLSKLNFTAANGEKMEILVRPRILWGKRFEVFKDGRKIFG